MAMLFLRASLIVYEHECVIHNSTYSFSILYYQKVDKGGYLTMVILDASLNRRVVVFAVHFGASVYPLKNESVCYVFLTNWCNIDCLHTAKTTTTKETT